MVIKLGEVEKKNLEVLHPDYKVSHQGGLKKIDCVPSEMIKLSGMTLIHSLLIPATNQNDAEGLNMSQI